MIMRAVYTFKDSYDDVFHVYKDKDGFPKGAAIFIKNAVEITKGHKASLLGAAFVAANHSQGLIELVNDYEDYGNLDYRYEVLAKEQKIYVEAFKRQWFKKMYKDQNNIEIEYKSIFSGVIEDFIEFSKLD